MFTLLLLIVVGCSNPDGADSNTRTGGDVASFIGGNRGLDLKFFDGAPPREVYDSQGFVFDINVRAENVGEFDIAPGLVRMEITGIDPTDFGGVNLLKTNAELLRGADIDPNGNIISGSITEFNYPRLEVQRQLTGNVQFNLRAEACYPYGTLTISQVCILRDMLGFTRKTGEAPFCEPNEQKIVENSGSPIQVTSLKESSVGKDKLSFTFEVSHIGEGFVYRKATQCDNTQIRNRDVVHVKVDTGIPGNLQCSGLEGGGAEGDLTMFGADGKETRSVVCTQELPANRNDHEKPITITTTFDYEQFVDQPVFVTHIGDLGDTRR